MLEGFNIRFYDLRLRVGPSSQPTDFTSTGLSTNRVCELCVDYGQLNKCVVCGSVLHWTNSRDG